MEKIKRKDLKIISSYLTDNRNIIMKGGKCLCCYCGSIFESKDIKIWVDDCGTALCPECLIDSVLSENCGYNIENKKFYLKIRKYLFNI